MNNTFMAIRLATLRQTEEQLLRNKVNEIKKDVIKTKDADPEKIPPKVQDILDCVEAKDMKLAIELIKRRLEAMFLEEHKFEFD